MGNKVMRSISRMTGVTLRATRHNKLEIARIRAQQVMLNKDMQKAIVRSVQIGEAKAKATTQRLSKDLKATQKAALSGISKTVERAADRLFLTMSQNRAKIADNYLSAKTYAATAKIMIRAYVAKGQGGALSSIGDFLVTVAQMSTVKTAAATGVGAGLGKMLSPFTGKWQKVKNGVSRVNGIVNEYTGILTQVKRRWPMGMGRYLMARLEESMQRKGIMLTNSIVKMKHYQKALAHL